MIEYKSIVKNNKEPKTTVLWLKDNKLLVFSNGKWVTINGDKDFSPEQIEELKQLSKTAQNRFKALETNKADKTEVDNRIKDIIGTAPEALDTLGEIADELSKGSDVIKAINQVLDGKASKEEVSNIKTTLESNINDIADIMEAMSDTDDSLMELIFKTHGQFTCSASPSTIEKGVTTNVSINTGVSFDGVAMTHTVTVDGKDKEASYPLSTSKTFNVVFNIDNADPKIKVSITKTAPVHAFYPKYYGGSTKAAIDASDITTFTKQYISSSAAGTYSITSMDDEYIWFCIPSTMNINKVTLGGFNVPLEAPIIKQVTDKGDYKCYRSSNPLSAGTRSFIIA